jgi:hypothetical protein
VQLTSKQTVPRLCERLGEIGMGLPVAQRLQLETVLCSLLAFVLDGKIGKVLSKLNGLEQEVVHEKTRAVEKLGI